MAYVVVAQWTAKPGEEEAVGAELRALVAATRSEPGNLVYQAHRDPADARVFMIYEQYVDEAAFQAHATSPHFRRHALENAVPRLEKRERSFYETWS
jgi:autoinducer 2-degrading protein